jgi:hypothetical protein
MYWCAHKTATLTSIQHTVGGGAVPSPPQYFADQLTLFQPRGGADSADPLLPEPPPIFSLSGITVNHILHVLLKQLFLENYILSGSKIEFAQVAKHHP